MGFGIPQSHPKGIWEQRPPNYHHPLGTGLDLTLLDLEELKPQQIQLPDGVITSGGAEGFGNEVFGVVFMTPQNPAPSRSRQHSHFRTGCSIGAPAAHEGLSVLVAPVSPPCSVPISPGVPEQWELAAPASMCPSRPSPKNLGCAARPWVALGKQKDLKEEFGAVLAARGVLGSCACSLGCASFAQPPGRAFSGKTHKSDI